MSFEIIYDKQFIKVSETEFIPMILGGSNNVYEFSNNGKERRSRSWFSLRIGNGLVVTRDEMIKYCEETRNNIIVSNEERINDDWYEEYDDSEFGYWSSIAINGRSTRQTTYGQFKGLFTTGCKKALTLEQLVTKKTLCLAKKNGFKRRYNLFYFNKLTQSLLQRWLREVHQIYVLVNI